MWHGMYTHNIRYVFYDVQTMGVNKNFSSTAQNNDMHDIMKMSTSELNMMDIFHSARFSPIVD